MWMMLAQRQALGELARAWDEPRRARYLLDPEVEQPLSIDARVWPLDPDRLRANVAFSVLLDEREPQILSRWFPEEVEGPVSLLGYDIADDVFLSGLSNCGYTDDDARALRLLWGPKLNRFHLFEDARVASAFRSVTDARVPEHAPFFVFGIYLIGS
ncbi:MAG: hypothetical protein FWD17_10220 [Polyangiaceae bacterium]|nr:hypothetical protein [Polyangiaceae bacterium]